MSSYRLSANIHSISTEIQQCVVTIIDHESGAYILNNKNIGLTLNPDGTANTAWIKERIKDISESALTPTVKKYGKKIPININDGE